MLLSPQDSSTLEISLAAVEVQARIAKDAVRTGHFIKKELTSLAEAVRELADVMTTLRAAHGVYDDNVTF